MGTVDVDLSHLRSPTVPIPRTLLLCMLLATAVPLAASALPPPAIPMTVKAILKTPPRPGQLLQVSGYLQVGDKETRLQDAEQGRRLTLDFSRSQVSPEALGATTAFAPPVMVIGRMQGTTDNGKPIVTVIGALNLTP
jgi:hypothetical protein